MINSFINLIFPITCIGCEQEWSYLCKECKKTIRAHPELCPWCHQRSPLWSTCFTCTPTLSWINSVSVAFIYEELIKKLVIDLKFNHRYDTWKYLGEKLSLLLLSNPLLQPENSIITHVPSHWRRKYIQKWYNQSKILASTVSKHTEIPHYALFEKIVHTTSQTKLSKQKRSRNLDNAFRVIDSQELPKNVKTIILIDDIVTTWSTLNALWKLYKSFYPNIRIECLVVARHMW